MARKSLYNANVRRTSRTLAALSGIALIAAACVMEEKKSKSDDDDDDGAGGGTPTGTATGTSTGTSTGTKSECDLCLEQHCPGQFAACGDGCAALLGCVAPCADQACIDSCAAQYPNDVQAAYDLLMCADANCPEPCGGGVGGSGGGGTTCNGLELTNGYWCASAGSIQQYKFYGNGTFDHIFWTVESGNMYGGGTWTNQCPNIYAQHSDGGNNIAFVVQNGVLFSDPSTYYYSAEACL